MTNDETATEDAAPTGPVITQRWRGMLALALLSITVALLIAGFLLWRDNADQVARDELRSAAVATARSQAVALTDVNAGSVDARIKQIAAHATGDFQRQFAATATTFKSVVVDNKVESTSKVAEAGAVSVDTSHAVVLVALSSNVHNAATGKDEARPYRIKVHLVRRHGAWLVEKMEFVG